MTIDEAIAKYKEITNTDAICPAHCNISCDKCVQESKQLVEWLEDYKRIKLLIPIEQALKNEYNKAIDDFANLISKKSHIDLDENYVDGGSTIITTGEVFKIAEQLKLKHIEKESEE